VTRPTTATHERPAAAPDRGGSRRVAPLAARRRAARRRQWRHRLARVLLVVLPLTALTWVLLFSSWLAVDRIEVVGVQRLSAEQVRTAAQVEPGTPLARLDTGRLVQRIGALPPVAEVQVSRSWPGALRVQVRERVAVAAVLEGGGARLVDGSGVVFATEAALPAGVVRLQVYRPGATDPSTRAALSVLQELPGALRTQVRTVRAASPSKVVLLLGGGKTLVWGSPGGAATKSAAARALLPMPGTVVDVSAPGVAVRR